MRSWKLSLSFPGPPRHVNRPEGYNVMGLEQQLEDFKQEFLRTAPAGRPALYEAKIEELRSSFALETAAGVGTISPDLRLPDVRGDLVSLTDLLRDGPVVVTFYRGGWCPYCNIQLRAYQATLQQ